MKYLIFNKKKFNLIENILSQMFRGRVPMLTRGSFASYYGGCGVLAQLGPGPSSPVSPVFVTISILFQVPLYSAVLCCTLL